MPSSHASVNPIVLGLQIGLQVLFLSLLGFAVVMAVLSGDDVPLVAAIAALMLLTYAAAFFAHAVAAPARRRVLRWSGCWPSPWSGPCW